MALVGAIGAAAAFPFLPRGKAAALSPTVVDPGPDPIQEIVESPVQPPLEPPIVGQQQPRRAAIRYVVIVSEDGMRPDLFGQQPMPWHDRLSREGAY